MRFDCGRMGCLESVFIADDVIVKEITSSSSSVYFGEVLGKHSEIYGHIGEAEIEIKSEDQELIAKLEELFGETISGHNPVEIYLEQKEERQYDED